MGTFLSGLRLFANGAAYDPQIPQLAEEILAAQCGGQDVQSWLDTALPEMVGNSSPDWYAIALSHQGYDLTAYADALENYIDTNEIGSATSRERMALALCACKTPAPACCGELLDASAGQLGVMSWIFALHLLNNGVESAQYRTNDAADMLVDLQLADGGWAVTGAFGDTDVTAMTLQALAPCMDRQRVAEAVDRGVDFLADAQLSNGGYQSWGTENPESTAQVWIALSSLGIDPLTDERFIKDGTILDSLLEYRMDNGQYCHTHGGAANRMATVQTYLAYCAAEMCENGEGSLFLLPVHADEPSKPAATDTVPPPQQHETPQTEPRTVRTDASATEQTASSAPRTTPKTEADTTKSLHTSVNSTTAETTGTTSMMSARSSESESLHTSAAHTVQTEKPVKKYAYRIPATVITSAIFLVIALICFILKKRSYKTYLTLAGAAGVVILLIWTLRIETKSQYYTKTKHTGGGTVTMEIRCDAICGMPGSEAYPADGVILPETAYTIAEDENALTLLYDAVRANELQIEVDGVSNGVLETAYVRGISNLYEFDFGELSGWTYTVNGERPPVGCGAFTLHDGDAVVWIYTVNL